MACLRAYIHNGHPCADWKGHPDESLDEQFLSELFVNAQRLLSAKQSGDETLCEVLRAWFTQHYMLVGHESVHMIRVFY